MRLAARALALLLFLLFSTILTACVLGRDDEPELGDTVNLTGNGVLVCSQACAARGQCGATAELGDVVLASTVAPATRGHDVAAPGGTLVAINTMVSEPILAGASGQESVTNYYQVILPDRAFPAWVAGWCITAAP
jgi:hypothetical protein